MAAKDDLLFLKRTSLFVWQVSGVAGYEVAVVEDGANATSFVEVGLAGSASITPPLLVHGARYRTIVRATDYVGLRAECVSNGFTIDATPPSTGEVHSLLNTSAADGSPQLVSHMVHVKWSGFTDSQSGLRDFLVALGRAGDPEGIQPFRQADTSNATPRPHFLQSS